MMRLMAVTTVLVLSTAPAAAFAPIGAIMRPSLSMRLLGGGQSGGSAPRSTAPLSMMASGASLKLFGNQGTRSPLCTWYLEEIGAPYEAVDAAKVDRSSFPAYPNPFSSIPAAKDGDLNLFESGAILCYIADKYGGLDTPEKRAEAGKWVMWANASLDPICFMENERGQVVGTKLAGEPRQIYVLNALLSKQEWLLGKDFSVADVAVASYLLYALLFNRSLKIAAKWPHVAAYCAKVAAYYCATAPRPLPAPFVLTAPRPQAAQRPAYVKAFGADVAQNLAARALA